MGLLDVDQYILFDWDVGDLHQPFRHGLGTTGLVILGPVYFNSSLASSFNMWRLGSYVER